jgi:hypothetical protein
MANYTKNSPYYNTRMFDGFLETWTPRRFPFFSDDATFVVTEAYRFRPDLLAFDLYGDARLWWVFAMRNPNGIKDPVFDFKPGAKIFIPKKQTLIENLGI